MVPTNDFVQFAAAVGANVEAQATYLTDSQRTAGQQPGIARSAINNKAIRQATAIASALAQFAANVTGNDVLDDGNAATLLATLTAALSSNIPQYFELTGSGNFALPVGCKYIEFHLCAAGGGGSAYTTSGSNGGNTNFGGTSFLQAHGGVGSTGGVNGGFNGTGGTGAALPSGVTGSIRKGGDGQTGGFVNGVPSDVTGGMGGTNSFGGAGSGQGSNQAATAGSPGTGAGGSGSISGDNGSTSFAAGGGGGAGEEIWGIIEGAALAGLGSSIPYVVGVGGVGATTAVPTGGSVTSSAGANGTIVLKCY